MHRAGGPSSLTDRFWSWPRGSRAAAQGASKTYTDSRGKAIVFPLGTPRSPTRSCRLPSAPLRRATRGGPIPKPPSARLTTTRSAWTPPSPANVVLGCAGTLVVRFVDNVLLDVAGPDLYVFEVGPAIEPMRLAISPDGTAWTEVGDIRGGTAEIDIAAGGQNQASAFGT